MWYKRPCPVPLLKVMALSVIHLQPLRLVLLDALMTDYMALVDSYLKSSHNAPDELEHVSMVGSFTSEPLSSKQKYAHIPWANSPCPTNVNPGKISIYIYLSISTVILLFHISYSTWLLNQKPYKSSKKCFM